MGNLTRNFSIEEFACPCCGLSTISTKLVEDLQWLRDKIGQPLVITSAVRCSAHNKKVGGVPLSAHVPQDVFDGEGVVGHAIDIKCNNMRLRYKLLKYGFQKFPRVGVGADFIHLDNDRSKSQVVCWDYYKKDHVA